MKLVRKLLKKGANFSSKDAVKKALSIAEFDEETVERAFVEFKNELNKEEFKEVPSEDKYYFYPIV